jgi:hypothetical protein
MPTLIKNIAEQLQQEHQMIGAAAKELKDLVERPVSPHEEPSNWLNSVTACSPWALTSKHTLPSRSLAASWKRWWARHPTLLLKSKASNKTIKRFWQKVKDCAGWHAEGHRLRKHRSSEQNSSNPLNY